MHWPTLPPATRGHATHRHEDARERDQTQGEEGTQEHISHKNREIYRDEKKDTDTEGSKRT